MSKNVISGFVMFLQIGFSSDKKVYTLYANIVYLVYAGLSSEETTRNNFVK